MNIKKQKGCLAEAKVLTFLIQEGFSVLKPWSEDSRCDLVAEKFGKFFRIQIKFVTPKNGCLYIPLRSVNNWSIIKYRREDVDVIAAYNPENDKIYFVPLSKFKNSATINLRINKSRNNQKKNILLADNFVSNLSFAVPT